MNPEEYPSETFCKYTNVVTGVLKLFERISSDSSHRMPVLFIFYFLAFVGKVIVQKSIFDLIREGQEYRNFETYGIFGSSRLKIP